MNKQEIFNKVARHLLSQGEKSVGLLGDCKYLDISTGRKCAVGCLLDQDTAVKADNLPDSGINDIITAGLLPGNLKRNVQLLRELQSLHDSNPPEEWRGLLSIVAKRHRLKTPRFRKLHPNCRTVKVND